MRSRLGYGLYLQNLNAVKNSFKTHGYRLSSEDVSRIEAVYQVFRRGGPAINYQFASNSPATSTPSYTQIATMSDDGGQNWNFLAPKRRIDSCGNMQGRTYSYRWSETFAGPVTIRRVGEYLKERNANVSAFYASNVESPILTNRKSVIFYGNLHFIPTDSTTTVVRFVDYMHNSVLRWFNPNMLYIQVSVSDERSY
jgi:hypothetical protein